MRVVALALLQRFANKLLLCNGTRLSQREDDLCSSLGKTIRVVDTKPELGRWVRKVVHLTIGQGLVVSRMVVELSMSGTTSVL